MTTQTNSIVGVRVQLEGTMESVQEQVAEALKGEGFGILTEIDVSATFKKKLDVDFRPYKILGACNPKLAHSALTANSEIGLLLPCNVTVAQIEDGKFEVSFVNPLAMLGVVDNPEITPIAEEAYEKLERAFSNL